MMDNFKYLVFFLEYLFLPLLAIYFALYIKSKLNSEQTLDVLLEDINVDFRIISSLGIGLYGLSLIGHNDFDKNLFYFYGLFGIVLTLVFVVILLLDVLKNNRKIPTISSKFFGLSHSAIYKPACLQIYSLYFYVTIGLILKKTDHPKDSQEICYFILFLSIFTMLFFIYINSIFNTLVIKLLNNQGIYTFNSLYPPEVSQTIDAKKKQSEIKKQIAEASHFLANKRQKDPSIIPMLQYLSELYETQGETKKAITCIDRIISLYEDKKINQEENNTIDAYVYKIELLKRSNVDNSEIDRAINSLKSKFPENKRLLAYNK